MGDKIQFNQMSNMRLQKHIRSVSVQSVNVFITDHARERMRQRDITDFQVIDCLRNGVIQRPPKHDMKTGDIKCRMEHFGTSRNITVTVALSEQELDLIVVTVMNQQGEKK